MDVNLGTVDFFGYVFFDELLVVVRQLFGKLVVQGASEAILSATFGECTLIKSDEDGDFALVLLLFAGY